MRTILLVSLLCGTASCSIFPDKPEPIKFPTTFSEIQPIQETVVYPTPLPSLPRGVCIPSQENCQYVGFDTVDFDKLQRYKITAEGNSEVATRNADATADAITGYNELIAAGRSQEGVTKIREEQLELERKEKAYSIFWHRVLILGLLGAVALVGGN